MHRVLLVCGAGASSQFIVQRIRRQAELSGSPMDISAAALELPPEEAPDLVYVGPHLRSAVLELQSRHPGTPVVLMTAEEYADRSGVLPHRRLLLELARAHTSAAPRDPMTSHVPATSHTSDGESHHG